jgi:hypothetical protein
MDTGLPEFIAACYLLYRITVKGFELRWPEIQI